jgi:hypothetical protein
MSSLNNQASAAWCPLKTVEFAKYARPVAIAVNNLLGWTLSELLNEDSISIK